MQEPQSILKKGKIANVIEMTEVYDLLGKNLLTEKERAKAIIMLFDFKIKLISGMK